MLVRFSLKKHTWQDHADMCEISFEETRIQSEEICCYCLKNKGDKITPGNINVKTIECFSGHTKKDELIKIVTNKINMVFQEKCVCKEDLCKVKFMNDLFISFDRKQIKII